MTVEETNAKMEARILAEAERRWRETIGREDTADRLRMWERLGLARAKARKNRFEVVA